MYIIIAKEFLYTLRVMIYSPDGLMRYNDSNAIDDDMPLLSQWIKKSKSEDLDFLSVSYEIDIFTVFAYEFELLHNRSFLVKSFAYAHGEIIYSVNCEI